MKLWSAIFVLCLLASSVQGVFAVKESGDTDGGVISEAPVTPEYVEYKSSQSPEWAEKDNSKDQLGYIPEPADTTHLKGKKVSKKALEAEVLGISDVTADAGEIVAAPATYDLRTLGRVSPVKNQGSCGSCWAFASYGSMESEVLSSQQFDFSENNLKNTHGFDYAACSGGNSQMATAYLARWSGAVAEASDPYVASSTTSPTGLPVQGYSQEILMIPGRSGPLDNTNIKNALQTTGALYTTMYWSSTYYNAATKAYYYGGTSGSNHAITIVGWDDSYSRTNFLSAPPGNGAFIIKNSWGTSWGDKGYFYMSYYDSRVGKSLAAFTGEPAAPYNRIYQYDPLGWISSMGYGSNTAWSANVFTATSPEAVSAVGLSTNQINTAYQVRIYTNPTQGPLNSAGPVATVSGTIGIPGYHTVKLPTPVSVKAGEKFSVVVKFQTPNYNYPITIEKPVSGYSGKATAGTGQSFISSTGTAWTDLTASVPNANACLKAYTVKTTTSATAQLAVTDPNGGESFVMGADPAITWTSSGDVGSSVKIELLKAGVVSQTISTSTPNDGTYSSWTIPSTLATGTDYRIRVTSTVSGSITDTSNNYFTISPASTIAVTSPNGGESLIRGTTPKITWTSTGSVGSSVKIELLKAGVVSQTISTSTPNDGTYSSWTIPSTLATGTDYRIRVTSTASGSIADTSNTYFTIASATPVSSITVTSPNGGESFTPGADPAITWISTGSVGSYVKIELLKAGVVKQTISTSSPNDGTYSSWTIPTTLTTGTDYRIRITSTTSSSITDTSNTYFTITPVTLASSITVASPNGGESLIRGTIPKITWTSTGSVGSYVKIELLKAGVVSQTISTSSPNDGTYSSWTIPSSMATGTDYRIRITSTTSSSITDMSNTYFTIASAPPASTITVTSPNGGESLIRGTTPKITWTSSGSAGSYVKIELLKAGVVSKTISTSSPNDGTYSSWTIPSTLATGTDYRIRITSTTNAAITDTSNNYFTIRS